MINAKGNTKAINIANNCNAKFNKPNNRNGMDNPITIINVKKTRPDCLNAPPKPWLNYYFYSLLYKSG